ncbi:thioredoxin family protein [Streptomyces sp. NPDC047002]|uniref:thioredoxin family protein n=1 Tax=Streptomyces sp. NPDC047002 TaxID=3155475 RepID=UPI0034545264
MAGLVVCVAVLMAAAVFGLVRRRTEGRLRARTAARTPVGDAGRLAAADLGGPLGARATLVQFSSEFCAPCRAVRRVLEEVSAEHGGVVHVELDASEHMRLVRLFNILRTPTVLVLDPEGRVVGRSTGRVRKDELVAAVAG